MGSLQQLDHARADADQWLAEPGRTICTYYLESYGQHHCVLSDPEREGHYRGVGTTEAEAIEAALAAARGRG